MTRLTTLELVLRMQSAVSPADAEGIRWVLEANFLPNQVIRKGAAELVGLLVDGLPGATAAGQMESWEILAQLSAGASGPTSAGFEVIQEVRAALAEVASAAVERLSSSNVEPYDFLAVDILDSLLTSADDLKRQVFVNVLRRFAERGSRERQRVDVILRDVES